MDAPTDTRSETDRHAIAGAGAPAGDVSAPSNGSALSPAQRAAKRTLDPDAIAMLSADDAVRLRVAPLSCEGGVFRAASPTPDDLAASDELSVRVGGPVELEAVEPAEFDELIRRAFGATAAQMSAQLGLGDDSQGEALAAIEAVEADDLQRMAEQPTLINLVNLLILEAIRERASDVHIEPFEKSLSVRYRVDGVLRSKSAPPKRLQAAITSRVKVMAGMNIAERYVPQDGHITLRFEGRKVDIRVSTTPTVYGESVVMRILDKDSMTLDLEALGMVERDRDRMDRLIQLPHGMVLVTGPTGSGKTTTLYAALKALYDPRKKIVTIEDPVEYELEGVNQIPVNPERGLSFASGLRSILRQDPDVIMVGEIRDGETADISVRAALTGHLVFATLHTNDAASAVGRLLDMGVEPFLVASVLEGVLAQRLGRRLCPVCRQRAPIDEASRRRLRPSELAQFEDGRAWSPVGCEACEGQGFRGRIGFYELLTFTSGGRAAITEGRTSRQQLLAVAPTDHVSMRADGVAKAAQGATTIEEVLRATTDADEGDGEL